MGVSRLPYQQGGTMLVRDLEEGGLYKIRADRKTYVTCFKGWLDIHVGSNDCLKARVRKNSLLVYLGKSASGQRMALFKGQQCYVYSNAWQHITELEDEDR
jgi:hypothetical protein